MKIAVVGVKEIPTKQGEIERYCQEFYPRIAAQGHQVDLFVQAEYHRRSWFSVRYYRSVKVIFLASLPGKYLNFLFSSALNLIWATFGNYDVIHIQGTKAAWFAWFPQLFFNSKVVVTIDRLDGYSNKLCKNWGWLLRWVEKTAVRNADELVVGSKTLSKYFQAKYQIRPRYIPNAAIAYEQTDNTFEYGRLLGLEPKRYFLYLGKITPQNQPQLLLKAWQQLQPGWKLVMVGEIDTLVEYAVETKAIALTNPDIIFTNQIKGQYLEEIISNAGSLVIPGDNGNLGLSLRVLEAMREGVTIVANDTAVHREFIGNRGLLFDSGLTSLVAKLKYVLDRPVALSAMTQKAQNYIAINHNWNRVTYSSLSLYLKLTATPKDSPSTSRIAPTTDY